MNLIKRLKSNEDGSLIVDVFSIDEEKERILGRVLTISLTENKIECSRITEDKQPYSQLDYEELIKFPEPTKQKYAVLASSLADKLVIGWR